MVFCFGQQSHTTSRCGDAEAAVHNICRTPVAVDTSQSAAVCGAAAPGSLWMPEARASAGARRRTCSADMQLVYVDLGLQVKVRKVALAAHLLRRQRLQRSSIQGDTIMWPRISGTKLSRRCEEAHLLGRQRQQHVNIIRCPKCDSKTCACNLAPASPAASAAWRRPAAPGSGRQGAACRAPAAPPLLAHPAQTAPPPVGTSAGW